MLTLLSIDNSGDGPSNIFTQLIIIVVLIIINPFFAASELAILSSNQFKINSLAQANNKKANLVKKLKSDETKFLFTIQVEIISLHDLNKDLNIKIKKENEHYTSLSGFITNKMESIPIQ